MRFDVFAFFPRATYGANKIPDPSVACFTHGHIEQESVKLGWLINRLFDDSDDLAIWGAKSVVNHGVPEWIDLRPIPIVETTTIIPVEAKV